MSKHFKFSILTAILVLFIGLSSSILEAAPNALSIVETSLSAIDIQTQSSPETIIPNASFSMKSLGRGLLGMLFLIGISFLFSSNRRAINWKMVGIGLSIQIILAIGILKVPLVQKGFSFVGQIFVNILDYTLVGSKFLLGNLLDLNNPSIGYIFAFQILPTIIFFSALTSVLFYLGVIQKVVKGLAWLLTKSLGISGAESLL